MAETIDRPGNAEVVLPPHGFVSLQFHNASDLDVVNAARVSFGKMSNPDPEGQVTFTRDARPVFPLIDDDAKVLRYLLKGKHGTPFEHTFFKWHIKAPIFVFREWHRHRIGISINEMSARYVKMEPEFYVPEGDFWREQVGKPGAYRYEPIDDLEKIARCSELLAHSYATAWNTYEDLMKEGVAKEIARAALPVGIYSQMIWTCNARSLMAFLNLRNHSAALKEIRVYAAAMEEIFAEIMPVTHAAFVENDRRAP